MLLSVFMTTPIIELAHNQAFVYKFSYDPVPELSLEGLSTALAIIELARQNPDSSSYGAFLIRNVGEAVTKKCIDELNKENLRVQNLLFTSDDKDLGAHADPGECNSITTHHTKRGKVEAIVLTGTLPNKAKPMALELTDLLFDYMTLDTRILEPPTNPLRATLSANDLLIFDHSQLHAFRALTEDRISSASWMD
jgi:hypothetical protein